MKSAIIIIQPILFQITSDLASPLQKHLSGEFDSAIKIASSKNDNPPFSNFDKRRRQWNSDSNIRMAARQK
jgi:predicted Zn-dependent protease